MTYDHVDTKTVRFWAWVDSSIWPLTLPWTAEWFIALIYRINGAFGGASSPPLFEPIHLFFVCLSGALVMVWVVARLLHPVGVLACIDGWARVWVTGVILYFVAARGAPPALLLFVLTELAGAVAQLRAVYRHPDVSATSHRRS